MKKLDEPATEAQLTAIRNKCKGFGFTLKGTIKTKADAAKAFKMLDSLIAQKRMPSYIDDGFEDSFDNQENWTDDDYLDPIY